MPFELLMEAAREAAKLAQTGEPPMFARRAHIVLWSCKVRGSHPWFERIAQENGYVNFTLSDAFFGEALRRARSLAPIELNAGWSEQRLFYLPVYAAISLRGAAANEHLSGAQKDALAALLAVPLEKNAARRLEQAAQAALRAFEGGAQEISNLLWAILARCEENGT